MHPTALEGFGSILRRGLRSAPYPPHYVLDIGGADVNGTVHRELSIALAERWSDTVAACYTTDVLDIAPGPGVTIVADATTWRPDTDGYDMVISTETLEHVADWRLIIATAAAALSPGGVFAGTAASTGRRPHGARGAHDPGPGEHYGNVDPGDLVSELTATFAGEVLVEYSRRPEFPTTHDVYWCAIR